MDSIVSTSGCRAASVVDGYRYWLRYEAKCAESFDHGNVDPKRVLVEFVRSTHRTRGNTSCAASAGRAGAEATRIAAAMRRVVVMPRPLVQRACHVHSRRISGSCAGATPRRIVRATNDPSHGRTAAAAQRGRAATAARTGGQGGVEAEAAGSASTAPTRARHASHSAYSWSTVATRPPASCS